PTLHSFPTRRSSDLASHYATAERRCVHRLDPKRGLSQIDFHQHAHLWPLNLIGERSRTIEICLCQRRDRLVQRIDQAAKIARPRDRKSTRLNSSHVK